jgi:hypothetical protein
MPQTNVALGRNGVFPDQPCPSARLYARDPEVRIRDIATTIGITERHAYGIVDDLPRTGYIVKAREGRRNRYQVQVNAPLDEAVSRPQTIGQLMTFLLGSRSARKAHSRISDLPRLRWAFAR